MAYFGNLEGTFKNLFRIGKENKIEFQNSSGNLIFKFQDTDIHNFTSDGKVGLGTINPDSAIDVEGDTQAAATIIVKRFGTTAASACYMEQYRARGTQASPTALLSGDMIGRHRWRGYDDTWSIAANINVLATEDWTTTDNGSEMTFDVIANGSTSASEVMKIANNKYVGIGSSAPVNRLTVVGTGMNDSAITVVRAGDNAYGGYINIRNTRGATDTDYTTVIDGDALGSIRFYGADSNSYQLAGRIDCVVDGTVSNGIVPTRLEFETTDSSGNQVVNLVLGPAGKVGINTTSPDGVLDCTPDTIDTGSYSYPFPRVTTTQRNALTGMTTGACCFDITLHKLYVYENTTWVQH